MASHEAWLVVETGNNLKGSSKENRHGRTAHNMSSSSLRKKSDLTLVHKIRCKLLRDLLANLQEVLMGTKLAVLFPAIPLAIIADLYGFKRHSKITVLRIKIDFSFPCFLFRQITYYTGPTVGGLLNATCGNATELIIAILALTQNKIDVVKYSLLGSILSNLLLVLGSSLFCGGLANLRKEQKYDRRQSDINSLLLLLALLCHTLPVFFKYSGTSAAITADPTLQLSRASSIVMLIAYCAYIVFQLGTHRQFFEADEEDDDYNTEEVAVICFWSGFAWLVGMTLVIALLSKYVVATIDDASASWGISMGFISIILLSIVGNAAEHAGAVIFAFKNKLDITLGVALGSSTQIALFAVPVCVIIAWIIGVPMDLSFNLLETASLAISIIAAAFALQDGTSHYLKGLVLLLLYIVIAACFWVDNTPTFTPNIDVGVQSPTRVLTV
ncbi:Na_Ca_ex domain-containing protein [Cephalotus follicularis]|uniref:Vacuolar cation/proton exchanger n=1 Tax=Cephalotus follicularis TaxID=3775 RepID=A0A1Q3C5Y2_CEPFO|nr:Na_Ca_ex domain-containing protein [Cephalotus follicularis]